LPDRRRVHIGKQFILLDASANDPVAVSLDNEPPMTFSKPTIFSRHRHAVAFGDPQGAERRGILRRKRRKRYAPIPNQSRLEAPILDLTAVVTERRVYRPDDEAHIFIIAPDHAGGKMELEVQLAGQQIMRETITLNAAGLALIPYADLEEGEYTVRVQRVGRDEWADCHFSVAEFTLSPLIVRLESHAYAEGVLRFHLHVLQLSVPYTGEAELGLQCAACDNRVVHTQKLQSQEGAVRGQFDLSDHGGPFKIEVTTPQGETAIVDLPGSGVQERERIIVHAIRTRDAHRPWGRQRRAFAPGERRRSRRPLCCCWQLCRGANRRP
jgi:hypothetical protein